ncbi:MAG: hypothetical protein EP329_14865 [Deltaproteobacteria bacterium]|nr:MAG: hypothetical protein EP329_14865 [Deltaproteobacteria bacterium]
MLRIVATVMSLVVPGSGQLLRGRLRDGLLFLWATLWFHVLTLGALLAAYPKLEDLPLTFAVGAFGVPRGFAVPVATVFTLVVIALHAWAARDAYADKRNPSAREVAARQA